MKWLWCAVGGLYGMIAALVVYGYWWLTPACALILVFVILGMRAAKHEQEEVYAAFIRWLERDQREEL